ncbi:DUF6521 family protein [Pedobacter aquatilis]|uniref:three component ABC system middle component n=1 Tax=Pedobacter aquatilis TaxID=351343 RepID=UPI0025B4C0C2|nr:three component ABC system middle component [Pedobacter aquatilis]MDN3588072.1 DUF6521 family protein [Pedobacter aquatilis]
MKVNEFDIFQNKLIGAHVIWEFSKYYRMHHEQKNSPNLMHVMPVLPLCLNKRVVSGIKERNLREGSMLKALDEHKDLFSGLQERMEEMADLTLQSIFMGSVSGLLIYQRETGLVIAGSRNFPNILKNQIGGTYDYADILSASKRIGAWFSQLNLSELMLYFNISY